jgi:mannosyltransferase OCH1-like enzyme
MPATRAIPKIIHRSWKDARIPHDVYPRVWVDSWPQAHPDWEHRLWTDDDNETLVRQHYPQFYDFYVQLFPPIKKADFCRFLYLHRYGGVYVDLDFVCLKNLMPLLGSHEIVLGKLSPQNDYYQIPNAFMASCAEHDFWLRAAWDAVRAPPSEQSVETLAGPFRLQWAYYRYEPQHSIVHGDGLIYPFDWINFTDWGGGKYRRDDIIELVRYLRDKSVDEISRVLPHAFCATFWTRQW